MNLAAHPGFELIAPFLKPVMALLDDDLVSEVMINPDAVYVERNGVLELAEGVAIEARQVCQAATAIARSQDSEVSAEQPLLDARLPDGSRIAVALPPCCFGGPALTIRKFGRRRLTLTDLGHSGCVSGAVMAALADAVANRRNILVSGGTGTGKTTLLAAVAGLIPRSERLVVVEDTVELRLRQGNVLRFEARRAVDGKGAVTVRDLVRAALRHRPDRILVGEVRGGEAWDLLQALNTGHDGSLSTLHASSAYNALKRCTSCVLQSGISLPWEAVQDLVGDVVDLVVHLERRGGVRRVVEALRVEGYDWSRRRWTCRWIEGRRTAAAQETLAGGLQ